MIQNIQNIKIKKRPFKAFDSSEDETIDKHKKLNTNLNSVDDSRKCSVKPPKFPSPSKLFSLNDTISKNSQETACFGDNFKKIIPSNNSYFTRKISHYTRKTSYYTTRKVHNRPTQGNDSLQIQK